MIGFDNKFIFSESTNNVEVSLDGEFYGYIPMQIYNLLLLINGKNKDDAINTIKNKFNKYENIANNIYDNILSAYGVVLTENEHCIRYEMPFYRNDHRPINLNRLRYFSPKKLVISLTRCCFMQCKYCYAGAIYTKNYIPEYNLNFHLIEHIIDEAKKFNIYEIDITGGDPFAREDIFQILDLFEKNGIKTNLSTKKLLDEDQIEKISHYKCIESIQISIDSIDDNEEAMLLRVNHYSTTHIKMIERMTEKNIHVKTNTVLTKVNIDNIWKLVKKLEDLGVCEIVLSPYMGNLFNRIDELFPSVEQYMAFSKLLDTLQYTNINYPEFLKNFTEDSLHGKKENGCGAGIDGIIISPSGETFVCERLSYIDEYSLGNIGEISLAKIWNGNEVNKYYMPLMEKYKGTKCYKCSEFNYCVNVRGICYVHSLILNKKLYSPDNQCIKETCGKRIY